jgi:hypothetical protein
MTDVEEDKQHDSYASTMLHLGRTTTIDIMKLYMIWKTNCYFQISKVIKRIYDINKTETLELTFLELASY